MPKAGSVEKEYQRTVVETLDLFGYHGIHVFPLMDRHGVWRTPTTEPGFPDLVYLREPRGLAIEVKTDGPSVPVHQRAWLTLFSALPCFRAWVVRPSDPPWDTLVDWIRRPAEAPHQYGFKPVENAHVALDEYKQKKRRRR